MVPAASLGLCPLINSFKFSNSLGVAIRRPRLTRTNNAFGTGPRSTPMWVKCTGTRETAIGLARLVEVRHFPSLIEHISPAVFTKATLA
jgi:hypothetical protein